MLPKLRLLIAVSFVTIFLQPVQSIGKGIYISIKEAPYYASITIPENDVLCGRVILSKYWAATAGHCVEKFLDTIGDLRLRTGTTTADGIGASHNITKIFIHDNYTVFLKDPRVHVNDIALIKLTEPIMFDEYQQFIRISAKSPEENDTVTIVGLGHEKEGRSAASLKKTELKVLPESAIPEDNPSTVFLTKRDTTEFCDGDSGGPGVIDDKLAGIMSYGFGNCQEWENRIKGKYAGTLTRVDTFYDWITRTTGIKY